MARYPGFFVGPGATLECQWRGPSVKWWGRVEKLAASHAPLQQCSELYNVAAVTCLGCVGQLFEPPE
eukprot:8974444-Pyramimonas_sp.AAC.1